MDEKKCGYLNQNNTCNYADLCDRTECIAILDNYAGVKESTQRSIEFANKKLEELKKRGYCICNCKAP
jgi:hypothetical protein